MYTEFTFWMWILTSFCCGTIVTNLFWLFIIKRKTKRLDQEVVYMEEEIKERFRNFILEQSETPNELLN